MEQAVFEKLKTDFNSRIRLTEKRQGVFQVHAPIYHDDGDAIEIYLTDADGGRIRVSDFGMTRMRLSYDFEIDSAAREATFRRILAEGGASDDGGNIFLDCEPRFLFPTILQFSQVVAKVSNMRIYRREFVRSEFLRNVEAFVRDGLARYVPATKFRPIPERQELLVDYRFGAKRPVFLFAARDAGAARLAVISCLEFLRARLPFRSVVVHEEFDALGRTDRALVTNAVDKQYTCLDEFSAHFPSYLDRELDAA
jgi:hypothetical protein